MEMTGSNEGMAMFAILITSIIAALIVVLVFQKYGKRSTKIKLPPGEMGLPFVGSTFSFFKPHSPTILSDYVKNQLAKHGTIFTTRLLGKTTIISADPDLNRFVMQNQIKLFANDFPIQIKTLLGENNMSFLDGEQHKHLQSMFLSFLNTWDIHTTFLVDVQKVAERVLSSWSRKDIFVSEETHRFAFSIIAEKALGLAVDDPEAEPLRNEFVILNEGFHSLPINLPKTRYWKALKAREKIVRSIKKRMERKKLIENMKTNSKDWIGWQMENNSDESVENKCSSILGLVVGGLINISIVIDLAIYFLSTCPKAVQQMQEEYLSILRAKNKGEAKITWENYRSMKFSQCVINETLRLGNVIPCLFKKAMKDIEFRGYVIPKGTRIMSYIPGMHLDSTAFERPEKFDPWRWQSMEKTNCWMPFGGGMRLCLGSELARIEITIFLQTFLHHYSWEIIEPDQPISFPPVVFPKKFPIRVYPLNNNL